MLGIIQIHGLANQSLVWPTICMVKYIWLNTLNNIFF